MRPTALRYVFFLSALLLLIAGCSEETPTPPDDLIPREQFVTVMADVQLVEALAKQKMIRNDDPDVKLAEYYGLIYEKYGIADSSFLKTYNWYHRHPTELLELYDEVLNRLSQVEEELKQGTRDSSD